MKYFWIFIVVCLAIGGIALALAKRPATSPLTVNTTPTATPSQQAAITSTQQTNDLRAGGSSYSDPNGVYTFLYPNDYTLDTQDPQHIRVYKRGEMQRPQSEMSDGVIVVFETIPLTNQTLEAWVDNHIQTATADGMATITQPKKATTLNTYPGFTYEIEGLGSARYIVVQKTPQSPALSITTMVSDPQQKNYQQEVDALLSTVELRK